MMTPTTASAPPTCEARTGYTPGEFAELPLWCNSRIGLSTWTDRRGITHRACRHHRAAMQRLYPVAMYEGMDDEWDARKATIDSAILADPERP